MAAPPCAAPATDVDNDVSTFTAHIVTGPTNGLLSQNADGSYTYTPNADFNGVDSFTYRVNEGALDSNPATVTITVASVNDAPAGQSSTVTTLEDMPYVFQMSDFGFSDAHDANSETGANNFVAVVIADLPLARR